jgi:hypothetical protein
MLRSREATARRLGTNSGPAAAPARDGAGPRVLEGRSPLGAQQLVVPLVPRP